MPFLLHYCMKKTFTRRRHRRIHHRQNLRRRKNSGCLLLSISDNSPRKWSRRNFLRHSNFPRHDHSHNSVHFRSKGFPA